MKGRYFSIGQISELLDIPAYTLRHWEKIFSNHLCPIRRKGSRRYYIEQDIDILKQIKYLVQDKGYTLSGANKFLSGQQKDIGEDTKGVVSELEEVLELLTPKS